MDNELMKYARNSPFLDKLLQPVLLALLATGSSCAILCGIENRDLAPSCAQQP